MLSHGQAKLKSVDSTPAIIKSAIVKVSNTFAIVIVIVIVIVKV